MHIMKQFSFWTQLIHVDTTNFSVYGKYDNNAPEGTDSIQVTFGEYYLSFQESITFGVKDLRGRLQLGEPGIDYQPESKWSGLTLPRKFDHFQFDHVQASRVV